jgi:FlaA1/EpsC-like NDP-sugar epimerase
LFEELSVAEEVVDKTIHPKIFVGRQRPHPWEGVTRSVADLAALADGNPDAIRTRFKEVVPEYSSTAEPAEPAEAEPPKAPTPEERPAAVARPAVAAAR